MKILLVGDLVFLVVSVYKKNPTYMVLQFLNCVPNWVKCIPSLRLAQAVGYEGRHSSTLSTHNPIITSQR